MRGLTPQGRRSTTGIGMDALARLKELKLPFAELLGIEFTAAAAERVVAEMAVREDLCTRPAVLHGGAIMAFADTLGAAGTILNLPDGAGTTTIESKTNFIAAAPAGAPGHGAAAPRPPGPPAHGGRNRRAP